MYCPGCGVTRSLKALLQFKLVESFCSNPFIILIIIDLLFFVSIFAYEYYNRHEKKEMQKLVAKVLVITLIIFLVYSIVRNVLLIYAGIDYLGDIL